MKTRMRLGTNEAKLNKAEDVFRIALEANSSTKNGACLRDVVVPDVGSRISIGEAFESETGQEI
jgi:hypothetical protein